MNIYLDIDGVLLANENYPARFAEEFIEYVVTRHPTFWLTTHCRLGENYTIPLLNQFFSGRTMEYLQQIRPTNWSVNKTEAIDFSLPFLWFDDDLYEEERYELEAHDALNSWIEVDLRKDQNALGHLLRNLPALAR